jgi:hypothetical protein
MRDIGRSAEAALLTRLNGIAQHWESLVDD